MVTGRFVVVFIASPLQRWDESRTSVTRQVHRHAPPLGRHRRRDRVPVLRAAHEPVEKHHGRGREPGVGIRIWPSRNPAVQHPERVRARTSPHLVPRLDAPPGRGRPTHLCRLVGNDEIARESAQVHAHAAAGKGREGRGGRDRRVAVEPRAGAQAVAHRAKARAGRPLTLVLLPERRFGPSVVAVRPNGRFEGSPVDGVHQTHASLARRSKRHGIVVAVVCFDTNPLGSRPRVVLRPRRRRRVHRRGVHRRREVRARRHAHAGFKRGRDDDVDAAGSGGGGARGGRLQPTQHGGLQHQRRHPERGLEVLRQRPFDGGARRFRGNRALVHGLVERHGYPRGAVKRGEVIRGIRHGLLDVLQVQFRALKPEREGVVEGPPPVGVGAEGNVGADGGSDGAKPGGVLHRPRRSLSPGDFQLDASVPAADELDGLGGGGARREPSLDERVDLHGRRTTRRIRGLASSLDRL
mmetsp:Transcript_7871/g.31164  ORF Transcript_7871/g.31164 Transcript_7871/m.31164 type:complete len:467 (-) Transcript_7871:2314-3714(-)